jgi:hypothetical protein
MTPATRYRIQPEPLHGTLCLAGIPCTGLAFALLAPDATTVMMVIMALWAVAAVVPARLVLGCDGFTMSRLGRSLYVPFEDVTRIERCARGVKVVRSKARTLHLLTYGIAVDAWDYAADLERRFAEWTQSPELGVAEGGTAYRSNEPDLRSVALNPRAPARVRVEAFHRIDDVGDFAPIAEAGAAFADPAVATEIERLKDRHLRSR